MRCSQLSSLSQPARLFNALQRLGICEFQVGLRLEDFRNANLALRASRLKCVLSSPFDGTSTNSANLKASERVRSRAITDMLLR